jgi:Plavaka transposase
MNSEFEPLRQARRNQTCAALRISLSPKTITMPNCPYCPAIRPTTSAIHRHQAQTPQCLEARRNFQRQVIAQQRASDTASAELPMEELHIGSPQPHVDTADLDAEAVLHRHPVQVEQTMDVDIELPISAEEPDQDAEQPRVMVEDVNDEEDEWVHTFPEASCAGAPCGSSRTLFETIHDDQVLHGAEVLGPFESDEEWQLAKWLIKNMGHNQAEHFLKLPIVSLYSAHRQISEPTLTVTRSKIQDHVDPSFMTKDMLMDTIDELPHGADWSYRPVTLHGDLLDDTGKARTEQLELWYRDPVEIVRELFGNPMFRDVM